MKPIFLTDSVDKQRVGEALRRCYLAKPENYPLLDREQRVYDTYANIVAAYTPNQVSSIIDLGPGTWRSPETIANRSNAEVIGLDFFSEENLQEYSRRLSKARVRLMDYDGVHIPCPDQSVDTIASLCVFEHVLHVEALLNEINRVLKYDGVVIVVCPNWSGINNPVRAIQSILTKGDRYWQYGSLSDSIAGIFRSLWWYMEVLLSRDPKFLTVFPCMKGSEIAFERSDDDVVHLCQPLSFKKYFKQEGYKLLKYNRGEGETLLARIFNTLLPSLATTNVIIARKQG